ncbi:MAG: sulfotransferase domain-containing protein, partial [Candidatus Binatia bacterium]
QAAAEIKNFCSSSQIVIMLRNPIDVMYALYHQRLYNGNEDIEDFTTALAAEEDRKRGSRLPKRATNVMGCFYRDNVKFTPQVQRYLEVFGRENVHIIIFDDLKNGMARVYRDCCAFLGVARNFQADFHVINPRKRVRSTLLRDLLHQPPPAVGWLWRALGLRLTHRGGYNGWLKRLNTTQANIPPMEPQLRRQLQEEFLPEVEQLSRLLDRDLTHWCTS